jgi:phosphoserine phosphatase RsbU/P
MADIRVLVVDDEELILQVLKEFFRQRKDHCDVAGNGVEALRLVEDRIYDLVLSDISMPGMDGLELIRRIKTLQPQTVCILMSGLGTRRDIISALKIGVFDFIDKPIPDLNALTMVVDRAAESGRVVRERDALLENLKEQNAKLEYSLVRLHEAFGQLRQQEEALESDLLKAQRVQRKFLPAGFPRLNGMELFGYYAPADQLGGDFFGTLKLSDGRTAIYLVDVAGHGVSAAMITVTFRELMRAERRNPKNEALFGNPGDVLRFMNQALIEEHFDPPIFVSMIYAVFDAGGNVSIASAGHPAPIYLTGPQKLQPVPCSGSVLGTKQTGEYTVANLTLSPNDALVFYSDGLTECRNSGGQELALESVCNVISTRHGSTARQLGEEIEQHLLRHLGGMAPSDDVSFIVASRASVSASAGPETEGELVPDSVKVVMPNKLRHIRTDARGRVSGGWRDKSCTVILGGPVTWQIAPALREIIRQGKERSAPPLHVDLSECESLDSTALGLLLQHAGELVLHQPGKRVISQLHDMGVLHHFSINHERAPSIEIPIPVAPNDTKQACSDLILSAHEALMEASASNRQKFKEVVDALRHQKT